MTREMRFKFIGITFYIVLLANLLLTKDAQLLLERCQSTELSPQVIIAALSFGAMLFTSDAIGYLFGTVCWVIWDIFGGWSSFFGDLAVKERILKAYRAGRRNVDKADRVEEELKSFVHDAFFCYFWHRAPTGLAEWASRRHLAFLINWSIIMAMIAAYGLSTAIVGPNALDTGPHWVLHGIVIVLVLALGANILYGLRDMKQLVKLWFYGGQDKNLHGVFKEIEKGLTGIEGVGRAAREDAIGAEGGAEGSLPQTSKDARG